MDEDIEALEEKLGYSFHNRELLKRALTHKSCTAERNSGNPVTQTHNEQLEFLGDAVLGFLVSEALVEQFSEYSEGYLSKYKAHFVSAHYLHKVGQKLDLGLYLLLGRGEEISGGRTKKALLANAVEAIIAAIYLDAGMQETRDFLTRHVINDLSSLRDEEEIITDFKGALQEYAQLQKLPSPNYEIVASSGPDHSKMFVIEASVGGKWSSRAEGASKKAAGQRAAEQLLKQLAGDSGKANQPEQAAGNLS